MAGRRRRSGRAVFLIPSRGQSPGFACRRAGGAGPARWGACAAQPGVAEWSRRPVVGIAPGAGSSAEQF